MRMAGEKFNLIELPQSEPEFKEVMILQQEPSIQLDPSTLDMTVPEMTPGPYIPGMDLLRDRYILHDPRSGVALLPNGEQGPAQGPNIPIKNYGGKYMPDATQPSGYKPTPSGFV